MGANNVNEIMITVVTQGAYINACQLLLSGIQLFNYVGGVFTAK